MTAEERKQMTLDLVKSGVKLSDAKQTILYLESEPDEEELDKAKKQRIAELLSDDLDVQKLEKKHAKLKKEYDKKVLEMKELKRDIEKADKIIKDILSGKFKKWYSVHIEDYGNWQSVAETLEDLLWDIDKARDEVDSQTKELNRLRNEFIELSEQCERFKPQNQNILVTTKNVVNRINMIKQSYGKDMQSYLEFEGKTVKLKEIESIGSRLTFKIEKV